MSSIGIFPKRAAPLLVVCRFAERVEADRGHRRSQRSAPHQTSALPAPWNRANAVRSLRPTAGESTLRFAPLRSRPHLPPCASLKPHWQSLLHPVISRHNPLERITLEAGKCGGRPCIRSTRFRVMELLELLAAGASHEEILRDYPFLEDEDIRAALLYSARQADHVVLAGA
jgi:uncharacterized protein (DUF433 family)